MKQISNICVCGLCKVQLGFFWYMLHNTWFGYCEEKCRFDTK